MNVFLYCRRAVAIVLIAWPLSCAHESPAMSVPRASQVNQQGVSAGSAPIRLERGQRISGSTPHLPPDLLTGGTDHVETCRQFGNQALMAIWASSMTGNTNATATSIRNSISGLKCL